MQSVSPSTSRKPSDLPALAIDGPFRVRQALPGDGRQIVGPPGAIRLRLWDQIETTACGLSLYQPFDAPFTVPGAMRHTFTLWRALDEGGERAEAMGGAIPVGAGIGVVWFLGAKGCTAPEKPFLRLSREWTERLKSEFKWLGNIVPDEREKTHHWLRWLGFDILPAKLHKGGVAFRRFRWQA